MAWTNALAYDAGGLIAGVLKIFIVQVLGYLSHEIPQIKNVSIRR